MNLFAGIVVGIAVGAVVGFIAGVLFLWRRVRTQFVILRMYSREEYETEQALADLMAVDRRGANN